MRDVRSGMVHITRDFLLVYEMLLQIVADARADTLRFEAVQALVGDDWASALYRLKEECHAIFRQAPNADERDTRVAEADWEPSGALLDLAVGSLFHEAMTLRENLYQQEIYQPRIAALAEGADDEARALFAEFERIRGSAAERLRVSVEECENLLAQTRKQLLRLIAAMREDRLIARTLYEERDRLGAIFEGGLEGVYRRVYGDAQSGFVAAAESYAESAYFAETLGVLEASGQEKAERERLRPLRLYAEGMDAFMNRDYELSLAKLTSWVETGAADPAAWLALAHSSLIHYPNLVEASDGPELSVRAKALADAIQSRVEAPR